MAAHELLMPYLRSCRKEIASPVLGKITGHIPDWLQGNILRVGAGLLDVGNDRYNHAFDGLALVRKFSIKDQNVTYQNRFLRSDAYRNNIAANRITTAEFGTRSSPDPCQSLFKRFFSHFSPKEYTDNALVNIIKFSDEYYASTETNYIWKIDPETLNSEKKINLKKHVPIMNATAHSHEDGKGSVFNVGSSFEGKAAYTIFEIPPRANDQAGVFDAGRVVGKIPMSRKFHPCYYHSFAMTPNYFVFVEQPLILSIQKLMRQQFSPSITMENCLKWQPELKTKFHVMRRSDGTLLGTKYTADPLMLFHHINTYEEDEQIVMDFCSYKNSDIMNLLSLDTLREIVSKNNEPTIPFESEPKRFVLPLKINQSKTNENLVNLRNTSTAAFLQKDGSIHCHSELLCEQGWFTELPRINYEKFNGRKYRYFYAHARRNDAIKVSALKVDVENKTSLHWTENGAVPSEPIFVAKPNQGGKEDEGVVLATLLFTDDDKKVALLVLNGETMEEIGRATFFVESSIPGDFHGVYIPK